MKPIERDFVAGQLADANDRREKCTLRSELDRFRIAYAHGLQDDVKPISRAAVEEGLRIFEAGDEARNFFEVFAKRWQEGEPECRPGCGGM